MHISILLFTGLLALVFSCLATAVMSYISLAVPIGPWIEPTLALLAIIAIRLCIRTTAQDKEQSATLATIAGGISGIVASACAWTFPALHFLRADIFASWFAKPFSFSLLVGATVFLAGAAGLVFAHIFEKQILADTTMPFPVAQMLFKTISAQNQVRKGYELLAGAISSLFFSALQAGNRLVPQKLLLVSARTVGWWDLPSIVFRLDVLPMLWAIGFITGHVIAIPFAVGAFTKIAVLSPLHKLFFATINIDNFLLAFCSGMIIQGALFSFIDAPKFISKMIHFTRYSFATRSIPYTNVSMRKYVPLLVVMGLGLYLFFSWFDFTFLAQLFVIVGAALCAYQLIIFMGTVGLAPLGRFATFVMLPGLVMFGFNAMQATLVAAFVEISGGIAADALSGSKLGKLSNITTKHIRVFQWFALAVTSCIIGVIFWFLINHFGLGSAELIAQKAQSRALLINAYDFNVMAIFVGALFGFVLKKIRVNASLVLGGLLMPFDWSLVLVVSGLTTYLVKDKEAHYPFWSGVFAASSIWMVVRTLL